MNQFAFGGFSPALSALMRFIVLENLTCLAALRKIRTKITLYTETVVSIDWPLTVNL